MEITFKKGIRCEVYPVSPSSMLSEQCSGTTRLLDLGQLGGSQPKNTKSSVQYHLNKSLCK